ncbi:MAG: hypothetical protein AAF292_06655 [Pseudomonadota bacterium]
MRKQYHFRPSQNGFFAWDVDRLVKLAAALPVETVPLSQIAEIDEPYWFYTGDEPTCRVLSEHFQLMTEADLSYPIILCAEGRVMDGMHRVTKALAAGQADIQCVRFRETPGADFTDVQPKDVFALID